MIRRPLQKSRRRFLAQVCAPFLMGTGGPRLWAAPGLAPLNHSSSESENSSPSSQVTFRDVATEAGITPTLICGNPEKNYIVEVYGSGCVWFDYNNDGYTDLYIVNGSTIENLLHPAAVKNPPRNYLFRNNGDGSFTDVTREAHVPGFGWGGGALAADYNNDGFVDLFVYNFGPNVLYRNNGDGTFTDVTARAGVGRGRKVGAGVSFLDIDGDGNLDLFVANYIKFTFAAHVPMIVNGVPAYHGPRDYPLDTDNLFR